MNGYIRKIVSVVLTLLFCVAVIVGVGVIMSVRNVNVEYIYYSSRGDGEYQAAKSNLDALKGENLMLLGDDDIASCVGGEIVAVESYQKVYPCTLNIVLKERLEQYARANSSGGYDVYDSFGNYMGVRGENINPADSSPNVLLTVDDQVFPAAVSVCGYFKNYFGTVRNIVERVEASYDNITQTSTMTLRLYSGLDIVLVDYEELAEQKISAVHDVYEGLSESQRLRGSIHAVSSGDSQSGVYAAYNALI